MPLQWLSLPSAVSRHVSDKVFKMTRGPAAEELWPRERPKPGSPNLTNPQDQRDNVKEIISAASAPVLQDVLFPQR
jgi:hypothetical protein